MKERPILFSVPMVRAILEGRKTQTRRIVKPDIANFLEDGYEPNERMYETRDGDIIPAISLCHYGKPGDRLWVREAWRTYEGLDEFSPKRIGEICMRQGYENPWMPMQFEADRDRINWNDRQYHPGRYRHARFMPRWASRILLEITDVRVERLQEMTEEGAISEGIKYQSTDYFGHKWFGWEDHVQATKKGDMVSANSPLDAFKNLWQSIHGPNSWWQNPWVWVVEFKKI